MRRSTLASLGWGTLAFLAWSVWAIAGLLAAFLFFMDGQFWVGCADRTCETTAEAWLSTGVAVASGAVGWFSIERLRSHRARGGQEDPTQHADPADRAAGCAPRR